MDSIEKAQHDILLIIITALFIMFATGIVIPPKTPPRTIVIPPG